MHGWWTTWPDHRKFSGVVLDGNNKGYYKVGGRVGFCWQKCKSTIKITELETTEQSLSCMSAVAIYCITFMTFTVLQHVFEFLKG